MRVSRASTSVTTIRSGLGLEPHTEEDGGDIFAPAGTKVQLTITTDKPVARRPAASWRWRSWSTLDGTQPGVDGGPDGGQGRLVSHRAQRRRRPDERRRHRILHPHAERSPARRAHPAAGRRQAGVAARGSGDRGARRRRLRRAIAGAGDQVDSRQGKGRARSAPRGISGSVAAGAAHRVSRRSRT